ncbi:MAG: 5-formyltetrahydrofolate cyclo-ligase [Burkholderiaceae bacterium]
MVVPAQAAEQRKLLRKQMIEMRERISPQARVAATELIQTHLSAWLARCAPHASTIALYSPHRGEVDLQRWARARRESFALPVVTAKGQPLAFAAWQPGEPTVLDQYGIAVPAVQRIVQPEVLLIPCVAFNAARVRLGYGGGYYDRTLAAFTPRPLAVGVAFAAQSCDFAAAAHDIALDAIITERGVV